jgi:hypothetical protein
MRGLKEIEEGNVQDSAPKSKDDLPVSVGGSHDGGFVRTVLVGGVLGRARGTHDGDIGNPAILPTSLQGRSRGASDKKNFRFLLVAFSVGLR